jgi:hypothetical protein
MPPTLSRRSAVWTFVLLAAAVGIAALLIPRTPQPLSYHHFADTRSWLGIPNFGEVASNALFLVAGVWGLAFLCGKSTQERFVDARERWPFVFIFLGLFLTAFGSAYYHLAPDNARLVWDRLPMTIVFMPLVASLVQERIDVRLGLWLLPVLITVGIGSVLQWRWSEQQGAGDLRFYAAVQLYALLALLAALLLPPGTRGALTFSSWPDFTCSRRYAKRRTNRFSLWDISLAGTRSSTWRPALLDS